MGLKKLLYPETENKKIRQLFELIRYLFAGGTAFVFDKIVTYLLDKFVIPVSWDEHLRYWICLFAGFVVGLIINNLISMYIVFTEDSQKKNSRNFKAFAAFSVVGVIGLALTIAGNELMIRLFGQGSEERRLVYNIIVAIPVLLWNYVGRRMFANKKARWENNGR